MAQTAAILVAIVVLAAQVEPASRPVPVLENVDLMDIVVKPAYDELQRAIAAPPVDRQAWAALYQKAARLAELENLLFFRPRATGDRGVEWTERAAHAQHAAAAVTAAALAGLQRARPSDFDAVRQAFPGVAEGCTACHRAFSREAPAIRP
jgi:hypothetical protein